MSYSNIFLLVSGVLCVLLCFIAQTTALECYECNSYNDSRCADDVPPDAMKTDCNKKQNKDRNPYILCRKIKQIIEFEVNGLPPDTRIIRTCGWDDSTYKNRCYQRSGFGGRQEVCACETDLCNGAPISVSTALPLTIAAVALLKLCL